MSIGGQNAHNAETVRDHWAMTARELLDALVAALRPLLDPEVCSPFISAWELDGHRSDIDGEEIHARIKALVAQYDEGQDA